MTRKRPQPRHKSRTHLDHAGTPISVHEECPTQLFLHEVDNWPVEDDRGRESMSYPLGWISDAENKWRLWYSGKAARSDRIEPDYPLYWDFIEHGDENGRHRSIAFETIMPVVFQTQMNSVTHAEKRMIEAHSAGRSVNSVRWERLMAKLQCWNHGMRVVEGHKCAAFCVTASADGNSATIELEPWSTSLLVNRILEQAMQHIPRKTTKYSAVEPLLKTLEFLGAMDWLNFGKAVTRCAVRYATAFGVAIPEPYCSSVLPQLVNTAAAVASSFVPLLASNEVEAVENWVQNCPFLGVITIEQIATDLLQAGSRGPRSPRRIIDRLRREKVRVIDNPRGGKFIWLDDYRRIRPLLLRHGNETAPG